MKKYRIEKAEWAFFDIVDNPNCLVFPSEEARGRDFSLMELGDAIEVPRAFLETLGQIETEQSVLSENPNGPILVYARRDGIPISETLNDKNILTTVQYLKIRNARFATHEIDDVIFVITQNEAFRLKRETFDKLKNLSEKTTPWRALV